MKAKQCHEFWSRRFCLPILPSFCSKVKIADVKKVWKPVTAMGRSLSVLPDTMELRTKWLVWWWLLFKGSLLSRTKVSLVLAEDGVSRSPDCLKMGYSSLQAPIFHLLSRIAYHASICRHAAKPQSLPVSVLAWERESGRPPTPTGSHGLRVSSPQGVYSPPGSPAYSAPFLALGEHPLGFCGQMCSWHTWPRCWSLYFSRLTLVCLCHSHPRSSLSWKHTCSTAQPAERGGKQS